MNLIIQKSLISVKHYFNLTWVHIRRQETGWRLTFQWVRTKTDPKFEPNYGLDGLTLTETAKLTGKSLANLSTTLRRGIERLQQLAAQPAVRARVQTESIHDQEETKPPD